MEKKICKCTVCKGYFLCNGCEFALRDKSDMHICECDECYIFIHNHDISSCNTVKLTDIEALSIIL